ncbi:hypothetical protein Tco_1195773 [Tanacetum coccineum]
MKTTSAAKKTDLMYFEKDVNNIMKYKIWKSSKWRQEHSISELRIIEKLQGKVCGTQNTSQGLNPSCLCKVIRIAKSKIDTTIEIMPVEKSSASKKQKTYPHRDIGGFPQESYSTLAGQVDSEPAHGLIVDIPHIHACKQTLGLSAADQASVFMEMMSVHISSGLVLHQMTSDHNRSELRIQDHSNEQSSSKLVPKVVL